MIKGGDKNTFSHLTIAEINGGIDGLLLGIHARKESWSSNRHSALTLSQVEIGDGKNSYFIENKLHRTEERRQSTIMSIFLNLEWPTGPFTFTSNIHDKLNRAEERCQRTIMFIFKVGLEYGGLLPFKLRTKVLK